MKAAKKMNVAFLMGLLCLQSLLLSGCFSRPPAPPNSSLSTETSGLKPSEANISPNSLTPTNSSLDLFIASEARVEKTPEHVKRHRVVTINSRLLLDESGEPRPMQPNSEITLNLFPDTIYTGVIEKAEQDESGFTWLGHLKNVENSTLTMVFAGGLLIGNFGSPAGVYEVSNIGGELYQIIEVDQNSLPGTEG